MRILHLLSQRPSLTGSGITLDAIVRRAAEAGHDQRVVVGVPADDPRPEIGGLDTDRIHPLFFGAGSLDFAVPGMSDVMPYPSTRFSDLDEKGLSTYRRAWLAHLAPLIEDFRPEIIQSHHVWLMSGLIKDVAPQIPVVTQCHATGLRQMELCPALADPVCRGCARNEAFLVLHHDHAESLRDRLGIDAHRIHTVGAGYREDLFHAQGRERGLEPALLYVGKYSAAKGVPWLLDVFERLAAKRPGLVLHVAGGGAGAEAAAIKSRMDRMAPAVVQHGQVAQTELAEIARRATVCVLPSFYEGLPLVLVEALACGCRLVATDLVGVRSELAPRFGDALATVGTPALENVDRPRSEDLPAFEKSLESSLEAALDAPPIGDPRETMPEALADFTWDAVYGRVERVWKSLA